MFPNPKPKIRAVKHNLSKQDLKPNRANPMLPSLPTGLLSANQLLERNAGTAAEKQRED